jgi:hypothetical protein
MRTLVPSQLTSTTITGCTRAVQSPTFSLIATRGIRPVRAISRAQTHTPCGSRTAGERTQPDCGLGRRQPGAVEHLRRLAALRRATPAAPPRPAASGRVMSRRRARRASTPAALDVVVADVVVELDPGARGGEGVVRRDGLVCPSRRITPLAATRQNTIRSATKWPTVACSERS